MKINPLAMWICLHPIDEGVHHDAFTGAKRTTFLLSCSHRITSTNRLDVMRKQFPKNGDQVYKRYIYRSTDESSCASTC